eukprot:TRINITY_DN56698_c0_g1_i1.p1 TRINITY_DN56698_c0_g1~~TRINITY_DN56698_c0_g1_i1.p1  ORF type:complete len:442 (-),score=43.24 TRINITY_DN56698_c0_g1_i1:361-1686(-)
MLVGPRLLTSSRVLACRKVRAFWFHRQVVSSFASAFALRRACYLSSGTAESVKMERCTDTTSEALDGVTLYFEDALDLLKVVRGDEVSAYSQASVRAFLRQSKQELTCSDHYNAKAKPIHGGRVRCSADELRNLSDASFDFYFISYAWEPPSACDPRRGTQKGEEAYLPSIEHQAGRPEVHVEAREWYAQAQAKSIYLECRGQRNAHPKEMLFWIERASLPQSGPVFDLASQRSFFLLEYILLSRALIAVASPHYFTRGWCLFEFAAKLATAPADDPSALGVAWKAFASFGTRMDGFHPSLYTEVLQAISIEAADFSVAEDRDTLLHLVDWLFVSRSSFDRFAKFAALLRLGRSCYTLEDREPFVALATREGFDQLSEALAVTDAFDPRKQPEALARFDTKVRHMFAEERERAVHPDVVRMLIEEASRAQAAWRNGELSKS